MVEQSKLDDCIDCGDRGSLDKCNECLKTIVRRLEARLIHKPHNKRGKE